MNFFENIVGYMYTVYLKIYTIKSDPIGQSASLGSGR